MISITEIKALARATGVPETTVERDYAQNWLLNGLYSGKSNLVFKGGTAIRKAYLRGYRFSDDLDFTLTDEAGQDELTATINEAKAVATEKAGLSFGPTMQVKEVTNGWLALVHYRSSITGGMIVNIKLDMTKCSLEKITSPIEKKDLIHDYSDSCKSSLQVYSLHEIMAEKMRALFDRGWPRDFYDVFMLWEIAEVDVAVSSFKEKCKFKMIEPSLEKLLADRKSIKASWENSLRHQMKVLPDFDDVFDTLFKEFQARKIG